MLLEVLDYKLHVAAWIITSYCTYVQVSFVVDLAYFITDTGDEPARSSTVVSIPLLKAPTKVYNHEKFVTAQVWSMVAEYRRYLYISVQFMFMYHDTQSNS